MISKTILTFALAAMVVGGVACTKSTDSVQQTASSGASSTPAGGVATSSGAAAAGASSGAATTAQAGTTAASGDASHGKQIFSANCASCHGASGAEGGVGPSLRNESQRKNFAQTVAWIKNPQPPMPKLYPSPLSEKDVEDVAAYVQTIH